MKRRTWKLWDAPCSHWTYCPRPLQMPCGWEMDVNDGHQATSQNRTVARAIVKAAGYFRLPGHPTGIPGASQLSSLTLLLGRPAPPLTIR